jgi:outer membrane protein TolC
VNTPASRLTRGGRRSRGAAHTAGAAMALAVTLGLWGCAFPQGEQALSLFEDKAQHHLGPSARLALAVPDAAGQQRIEARLAQLQKSPLGMDEAVEWALLRHPMAQMAAAQVLQADAEKALDAQWGEPKLGLALSSNGAPLQASLAVNLLKLFNARNLQEQRELREAQSQDQALSTLLGLADATRRAWVDAVASQEALAWRQDVLKAAGASAELTRRGRAAGHFTALDLAQEELFEHQARLALQQAQRMAQEARSRLHLLLGHSPGSAAEWQLPARLPPLPAQPPKDPSAADIQTLVGERIDVALSLRQLRSQALALGLTERTASADALSLSALAQSDADHNNSLLTQWGASLQWPLFDAAEAQRARNRALLQKADSQARAVALEAGAQLQQAHLRRQGAWHDAQVHQQALLPLQQRISHQKLLRYNGMFISVFDLLADARAQLAAVGAAQDALRAWWLSESDWQSARLGAVAGQSSPADARAGASGRPPLPALPAHPGGGHGDAH